MRRDAGETTRETHPDSPNGKIALIGLGLVGSALADRFLRAGTKVIGFDINAEAASRFQEAGGIVAHSPREAAAGCRRVVLSLPTSETVNEVLNEIGSALDPGAIIIDSTTGEPEHIEGFGTRMADRQVQYLDATIGGSSEQVRAGEAIVLCGGDADSFAACEDLFSLFCRKAFHLGPCGSGTKMKLVLNLVLGLHRAVLAEALSYAAACGIDPGGALEILKDGPAYSSVMDVKGQRMLTGDFSPVARLSQHLKDVRLILGSAERFGAPVPFSKLHGNLLQALEDAGFGDEDNSAVIRAFGRGGLLAARNGHDSGQHGTQSKA